VTPVSFAKIVFAMLGLGAFLWGAGHDVDWMRWSGLALLAAAFLLRLRERGERRRKDHGPSI
jgi:hypothetical protein